MGCRQSKNEKLEETEEGKDQAAAEGTSDSQKLIVVFGATGLQGGSVVRALKGEDGYKVRAVTRNPDGEKAKALAEDGVEVVQADLDDVESLKKAVDGAYGVYAVTATGTGFTDEETEKEIQQGKNIADVVKECGVKHLIFSGLEDIEEVIGKRCKIYDPKPPMEKYIKEQDLPVTFLRIAFYYENLTGDLCAAMKFIRKGEDNYIFDIPVGDNTLPMMSIEGLGGCVKTVFADLEEYKGKTLALASDKLKMEEAATILAKHLEEKIVAGGTSPEDFAKKEDIPGAAEMAVVLEFATHEKCIRDVDLTRKLNPDIMTFDQWVENNKDALRKVLEAQE